MQYQMMNNDDDITNPVMRGVSLLDDTSTVNYTSDGETATSTLASDDPFSLLHTHESYRAESSGHLNLFGITDDDSSLFGGGNTRRSTWSHTDTTSFSNAGSSYEEMPFMASISNNNTNNNNNNNTNINDDNNDADDREQKKVLGMMGQNEQPLAPSTPVNNDEANNDYACEMILETKGMLNKFINGTIFIVQTAFGCCYDQLDGVLIRLYNVKSNNQNENNNDNVNDIGNKKKEKEKETLPTCIAPISREKDESREDDIKNNITTNEQTSITITEPNVTAKEITPRSLDMRDDSNITTHRDNNNTFLNGKADSPITDTLSNDSMNESVQRFKEYLCNRYEDKNQSESKERAIINSMEDTDDRNDTIVTPLSWVTKHMNETRYTSVTKEENSVDILNYENANKNLNTSITTTKPTTADQLSVTISKRDRYLTQQLPRRISTVVDDQSPTDMLREENNIDSQTRTRKETEMIKQRINSSLFHLKSIEGCEDRRDDQIESSQNTSSTTCSTIQRMKCHTQAEERKPEITIDLTMMEDIL
ncbi:MAG: hypothetical protein ACI8RD_001384 [Bacillariaceae sp.]|jgi:hypothetical protein